MKLKDKFNNTIMRHDLGRNEIEETKEQCAEIAEDFALGFSEWVRKETYYEHLTKEFIYKRNVYESEKELLEIYKKEKGLL